MLVSTNRSRVFRGVCAPDDRPPVSPNPLTIREVMLATASPSHDERGLRHATCPVRPILVDPAFGEAATTSDHRHTGRSAYSSCPPFWAVSGRSHKETWAGCIVSLTTPTRSSLKASRSVSSLSLAEKASRVMAASYLLR